METEPGHRIGPVCAISQISKFPYDKGVRKKPLLLSLIALGVIVRLMLIPNPGFEADISFWKSWGLAAVDKGAVEGIKVTNNNYPTPFVYTLGSMVGIYKLFADPHNFNEYWSNTNLLFLVISKLLPILADLGIALLILYIGKNTKSAGRRMGFPAVSLSFFGLSFYELLAATYLLSPVSLIDGAWWGQVDSVGVCIFLTAMLLVLKKQPFWAGLVFMLAMMTKLQNMIYGPVLFLFVWQVAGLSGLIRAVAGALVGFVGLNAEFLASRNADRVFASLTENYDYFPWMSLMAYNLWWIVTGAKGLMTSDKLTVLGILNAKTVGLVLFSATYLFAVLRQLWEKSKTEDPYKTKLLLESLILVNAAFFLFQTQSHDRYAYPLSVFLLLWAPFVVASASGKQQALQAKIFFAFYGIFSLCYFYNLHTALAVNYPHNGLPWLSSLTQPVFTLGTAYMLLALFGIFVYSLLFASKKSRVLLSVTVGLMLAGLLGLNMPLLTRKPVRLTTFTPFISEQAYGTRQTNRSVQSSFGGAYKWTRLSVQYLFYDTGIGTHARSKHVFDIDNKFKRFTVDFGIDTEAGTKASATFEIWGDDRLLFRSDTMGRYDLPKHADVEITGVKHLSLITTDAGDGNYDDHTDWLNPRLFP